MTLRSSNKKKKKSIHFRLELLYVTFTLSLTEHGCIYSCQVRDFPVKSTAGGELDKEAKWIYKHAFLDVPISQQV